MADADFTVKAMISAQTSQFEKGLQSCQSSVNSLSNSLNGISNLVKKAFAFTGLAVGTKAIVDFGKSCVQSATQAEKQFNILSNTIQATGATAWTSISELESASKSLSDSTNYSVTEIQNMQSVLLGFTNITGEAFDGASEAVLDMATVMGMDLTSAVQTVGKALDDPVSGLDSLRRQGFKFTDEQKAELAQLVKNGKQLEAQKIILDTLATSYGGASKAGQDSFAKQRHAMENFQDTLGGKLIPIMKIFAQNNANMLNSLTNFISKIDVTPIVSILTNLNEKIQSFFGILYNNLISTKNEIVDFISRFNFEPIISILDTLIGVFAGVISKFKEMNSQKLGIFDKLKESLINFSNSETFQNIVNFINKIIDAVFFLWSEIQDIVLSIRNLIINKVVEIWNKIKEFFQNSEDALANSGQEIASWGDFFWTTLDNAFKTFQDFINMIKAMLNGDWAVAWEYAKLTVMRIVNTVLDLLSTVANAFPDLINVFIKGWNFIIEQINKARALFGQDPLDLANMFESTDLAKKTGLEKKIEETEEKIKELTGKTADISIKELTGVSAKFQGFTANFLSGIADMTSGVEEGTKKQKTFFNGVMSDSKDAYQGFSEWDSKLLKQRLDNLDDWSDEAHKINLLLIEEERKKSLEADKTGKETLKINKYYDNLILEEYKKHEERKRTHFKETINVMTENLKSFVSTTAKITKQVFSVVTNVFSSVTDVFKKLFDFNVNDALDNILKFEDAVLTFFVETLPQLPGFVSSALNSIMVLFETIFNSIDINSVFEIIKSIISTAIEFTVKMTISLLTKLAVIETHIIMVLKTIFMGVETWIRSGGFELFLKLLLSFQDMIENLISDALENLSNLVNMIVPKFIDFLLTSIKHASESLSKIITPIVEIFEIIIQEFLMLITSDDFIKTGETVIESLLTALIPAVTKLISNFLPRLITLTGKMSIYWTRLAVSIVKGIVKGFKQTDWKKAVSDIFSEFKKSISEYFNPNSFVNSFKDFGKKTIGFVIDGIEEGLQSIFSVFEKIISPIKSAFENIFNYAKNIILTIYEFISKPFEKIKSVIDGISNIFEKITSFVDSIITKVVLFITWVKDSISGVFGGIFGKLFGFANGTNSAPKGLALVGEAGPELVRFNGGEQILNTRNTQKVLENSAANY